MNKNVIAFKKGLIIPVNDSQDNRIMVSTMQVELLKLGYVLTEKAFMELSKSDPSFIEEWFNDVVSYLKKWLNLENYQPIYRNFPTSVMNRSIEQLFFEQLLNYWTCGEIHFDEEVAKEIKYEPIKWKEIAYGTEEDFKNIFKYLVQSNVALTPADYAVTEWFVKSYGAYNMPETIPFKENLCMLAALDIEVPVKTSTDVLRIASYLSHGDSTLILPPKKVRGIGWRAGFVDNPERENYKFHLNSKQRDNVMNLLDKVADAREMKERYKMWNKLAHHIHPTKFEDKYPNAVLCLRAMDSSSREFKNVRTFNSLVENAMSVDIKLMMLEKRPGVLARKLNELILHNRSKIADILLSFQNNGHRVSNKVLFELMTYFLGRNERNNDRKVIIKGKKRPVKLPTLETLSMSIIENIVTTIFDVLSQKFSLLESLGKVYLDEELKKIPLPYNLRTLDDNLSPVIRGQRNPVDLDKRYMLLYCCWKGRYDNDFTCSVLTKKNEIYKVGYGGYGRSSDNGIVFSGDNTGRYEYNSELISIDLERTDAKYILVSCNAFSGHKFSDADTIIGIMSRADVLSSQSWKPETVQFAMKPTTTARQVNAFIVDVEAKEWILLDEDAANRAVSNTNDVLKYIKSVSELPKFSVYDLLMLHATSRGELVVDPAEADTQFLFEQFAKDYSETVKFML